MAGQQFWSRSREGRRLAAAFAIVAATVVTAVTPAAAAPFTPATVTVTRVIEGEDPDPGLTQGDGDYFADIQIGTSAIQTSSAVSGEDFEPFWVATDSVDRAIFATVVPVTVTLWDDDDFPSLPNDIIDVNPADGVQSLLFNLELDTGSWTAVNVPGAPLNQACFEGDGDREDFGFTEGGERGTICLDFSTLSISGDADGDGLLDGWETLGYDADGDGVIDVDLPGFGADPNHKDLFVELDAMPGSAPSQAAITAMKAAFAVAPITAGTNGSTLPGGVDANLNPDGTPGINLWVDTGTMSDPTASEDGFGPGTCGDGVDNAGEGSMDGADTDCLIGDNLGGGNLLTASVIRSLDDDFYAAKGANFDSNRRLIFRYSMSAIPGLEDGSTDPTSCSDGIDNGGEGNIDRGDLNDGGIDPGDPDCLGWAGGWGELGGNDFIDFNHDGGSIMHELGHNLNLRHGGNENANCKSNYVSVMNYDNQFGIRRNSGNDIIDFSPPRTATGRGAAPLPTLVENNLNEPFVLDTSDASNQFVFTDAMGNKVRSPLNAPADYDGDGDSTQTGLTVNIDNANTDGNPAACANGSSSDIHTGFDDWSAISLQFRQFGDAEDGYVGELAGPEITLEELLALEEALSKADVSLAMVDDVDPAAAGTEVTYTLTATNNGPNPADNVVVTDTLPAETSYISDDAGCDHFAGIVTCDLGILLDNETAEINITVLVDPAAVYDNGGPLTITNNAVIDDIGGTDVDETNNAASEDTLIIAEADVAIDSIEATVSGNIQPGLALIGEDFEVEVAATVSNGGPSSPIDVDATTDGSSVGNSVDPAQQVSAVTALASDAPQVVTETFTATCEAPGVQTFSFSSAVDISIGGGTDPDLTNNTASVDVEVDCVIPVAIQIKGPGDNSPLNVKSTAPVTVLSNDVGEFGLPTAFDATTILADTLRFGTSNDVLVGNGAPERHGRLHGKTKPGSDVVTHYVVAQSSLDASVTEACVLGSIDVAGTEYRFYGCDSVRVIVPRGRS